MAIADSIAAPAHWLVGGGEMGELIRAHNWSATPLGPPERWPQSLRSAVSILLPSRAQICLFWGRDLVAIYNDAYRPALGVKHPWALGRPAREVWSEFWDDVLRPLLEGVLRTGEAFWAADHPFFLERHGYPEETYFDVSYDPVRDETGGVGGVFCIVSETTGRVIGEHRLRTLSDLERVGMQAQSSAAVFASAARVLSQASRDIPFALFYEWDAATGSAQLREAVGIAPDHPAARATVTAGDPNTWPLSPSLPAEGVLLQGAALAAMPALPGGPWPEPCARVTVLPIAMPSHPPEAFVVAGASPRRPFDAHDRDYVRLIASATGSALANANALQAERRRVEALAEIDRAKTTFFNNVSHEFRTPLTLLLGPLREELAGGDLPDGSRRRLEVAYRNSLRLLKLVNTLLDFSRIEAGRMQARFEPTDLARFTSELASNFESACDRAGLWLRVDCQPVGAPVYVDRDMWEKVVLNLLSNAIKFTFDGGIAVTLRAREGRVVLTVRDTGVGIPAQVMPRIFERFYRAEGLRARTHEGSGIGLSLVHELVRLHGGDIRVESGEQGSAFHVSLPLGTAHLSAQNIAAPMEQAAARHAAMFVQEVSSWLRDASPAAAEAPRDAGMRERILVADDNADMREYLERLLADSWEVTCVTDGESALEALHASRFNLLLTDVMMPRLDGFALLRAVREEPALRDLPVIMVSARAGEEARLEGREAGADDYLTKPFTARELIAQVRAQLALARARRATARERELVLANEREAHLEARRQWEDIVQLFEQAPNPMVILRGDDFVIELANPAACAVWGRTLEQVHHRPLLEALPELRGQGFDALLMGVLRTGQPYRGEEVAATFNRGSSRETIYFNFVYSPLRGVSGRVEGIAVTAFDVTEQVLARERAAQPTQAA